MPITLLDLAADSGRSFALIHFSGAGGLFTDVFRPGEYSAAEKMAAAERFLGGGTDFKNLMRKVVELMETGGFEQADVVFITDGELAEIAKVDQNKRYYTAAEKALQGYLQFAPEFNEQP